MKRALVFPGQASQFVGMGQDIFNKHQSVRDMYAQAQDILGFFGTRLTGYRFDQPAFTLSYANRRRLEIARAMGTQPTLLLLDEPCAGLAPDVSEAAMRRVQQLVAESGVAVMVVEQRERELLEIANRVLTLDLGQITPN